MLARVGPVAPNNQHYSQRFLNIIEKIISSKVCHHLWLPRKIVSLIQLLREPRYLILTRCLHAPFMTEPEASLEEDIRKLIFHWQMKKWQKQKIQDIFPIYQKKGKNSCSLSEL